MIYVDSREGAKHADILEVLSSQVAVELKENLPADFLLTALPPKRPLLVERKTINDFVGSLRSKRLFDQIAKMKAQEADCCIVLEEEGMWAVDKFRKWAKGPLMRLIDSVVLSWKVPVIPSYNPQWTAEWLALKAKELDRPFERREYPLRGGGPSEMSLAERQLYLMEGVGGRKIAENLLRAFRSVQGVANASVEELERVELVGKKRARLIHAIMTEPWQPESIQ